MALPITKITYFHFRRLPTTIFRARTNTTVRYATVKRIRITYVIRMYVYVYYRARVRVNSDRACRSFVNRLLPNERYNRQR